MVRTTRMYTALSKQTIPIDGEISWGSSGHFLFFMDPCCALLSTMPYRIRTSFVRPACCGYVIILLAVNDVSSFLCQVENPALAEKIKSVVKRIKFYPIILVVIYMLPISHRIVEKIHHDHGWIDQMAYSSLKLQVPPPLVPFGALLQYLCIPPPDYCLHTYRAFLIPWRTASTPTSLRDGKLSSISPQAYSSPRTSARGRLPTQQQPLAQPQESRLRMVSYDSSAIPEQMCPFIKSIQS